MTVNTTPDLSARELLELYAVLGRDVAAHPDAEGALEAITNVAAHSVPGAHSVSITRGSGSSARTVAPTDDMATVADRLQYDLQSGPCVDAIAHDTLFVSGDLRNDARWPKFGPQAAAEAGVNSILAVRLVLDEDDLVAALNVYSRDFDAFPSRSVTVAMLLATHGALAVSRVIARERAANLKRALETNREIGTAMGVLMTIHRVTRAEAFDLLRIASQEHQRKLYDVACDVADTGVLDLGQRRTTDGSNGHRTIVGPGPPTSASQA